MPTHMHQMFQWQLNMPQSLADRTHTGTCTDTSTSSLPTEEAVFPPAMKSSRSKSLLCCSNRSYSSYSDVCQLSYVGCEHSYTPASLQSGSTRLHIFDGKSMQNRRTVTAKRRSLVPSSVLLLLYCCGPSRIPHTTRPLAPPPPR